MSEVVSDKVVLENEELKITINKAGAELVSIVRKQDDTEYMWSGDSKYWGRVSPVLFPFVGKLNNQSYTHKGETYSGIPQHGFARDSVFTVSELTDDTVWMELERGDIWAQKYPYDFNLRLGYRLEGCSVHVMWNVINTGAEQLHFQIGAHPAFVCDGGLDGYALDFHNNCSSKGCGVLNSEGVLSDEKRSVDFDNGVLALSDELFDKDALIFDGAGINTISIINPDGKAYLQVRFDAPQLGIWSPVGKKAPFVCIEPWYGRSDRAGYQGELADREYSNTLEAGHSFNKEYVIDIL